MGTSSYAESVLKLIDPDQVYFGHQVIAREASPDYKTLELVKADDKRRVVIVDDTVDVWLYDKRNLCKITGYNNFRDHRTRSESYAEEKKDESRSKGSLASVLKFLQEKKLHLVLDLDHTLVHSRLVSDLFIKEKYLLEETDSRLDLWRCNVPSHYEYLIKLRPYVHEFLLEANKLFTMHVYTLRSSSYVKTVLKLIDPDNVYFGHRVVRKGASPYYKTLDLVLADKRRVLIVDSFDVWPYDKRNLYQITEYRYFRKLRARSESYAEQKKDESRSKGSLANVLKFLQDVHKIFKEELDCKDV
ncbi:hypothetical protein CARUB_v10012069mg, partial [Capsella rubella]